MCEAERRMRWSHSGTGGSADVVDDVDVDVDVDEADVADDVKVETVVDIDVKDDDELR